MLGQILERLSVSDTAAMQQKELANRDKEWGIKYRKRDFSFAKVSKACFKFLCKYYNLYNTK